MKESFQAEEEEEEEEEEGVEDVATKEVKTEGGDIEGTKASRTAPWEDHTVKHAPEAKAHVKMGTESKANLETEAKEMNEGITLGGIRFEPINESWMEEGQSRSSSVELDSMIRDMANKPFLGGYLLDYKNTGKQVILWVSTEPAQLGQKTSDIPRLGYVSIWAGNENWNFDGIDSRKVSSKDLQFLETIKSLAFSMEEGMYEEGMYEEEMNGEEMGGEENVGDLVADKLQDVLSPEELNFLAQAYKKGGKEMVASAIEGTSNESVNEDSNTEPPVEGEFGMSRNEIKLRQILDKVIKTGALGSLAGLLPAAMMGHPFLALGLGVASLVGCGLKDAAWWKGKATNGEEYPHHHGAQNKYGVK